MRVLRAKAIRRFLRFYKVVFRIIAPYHILLDGNFIFTAIKLKIDLKYRLESLLQEKNIRFYVLQSVIDELEKVGEKAQSARQYALQFCDVIDDSNLKGSPHENTVTTVVNALKTSSAGNGAHFKYFVATQDFDLRSRLKSIPGVPTIYLNKVTLVLEAPSEASIQCNSKIEDLKMSLHATEEGSNIETSGSQASTTSAPSPSISEKPKMRIKKKASAPNSLAMQKPKPDSGRSEKKRKSKFKGH